MAALQHVWLQPFVGRIGRLVKHYLKLHSQDLIPTVTVHPFFCQQGSQQGVSLISHVKLSMLWSATGLAATCLACISSLQMKPPCAICPTAHCTFADGKRVLTSGRNCRKCTPPVVQTPAKALASWVGRDLPIMPIVSGVYDSPWGATWCLQC